MRKSDILVGHTYTNGQAIREVTDAGTQCQLYPGQDNKDCVRYRLLSKGKTGAGSTLVGEEYNTTRVAFAYWARNEVESDIELWKKSYSGER